MPDRLPQSSPFRFVDRLLEIDPGRRCVTLKIFSSGELLLEGASAVPASLVMEALCQSAAFLPGEAGPSEGRIVKIEEFEMTGEVKPGDRLLMTTTLLEEGIAALRAESRGEVEGRRVARLKVLIGRPEN
jgi:3-hydroxymyristoyl/3-hydroxydecanoyl-(acyl carrier protein) dehydratase